MKSQILKVVMFTLAVLIAACGADSNGLDPTDSLSAGSSATIGILTDGKAAVYIPTDEIGGDIEEGCTINIAVNNTARNSELNCDDYFVDASDQIGFNLGALKNDDAIEIVITNGDATYIFTFTVSEESETGATRTSSSDADSDGGSASGTSTYAAGTDYLVVSAIDDDGQVTFTFSHDILWDAAAPDEDVVFFDSVSSHQDPEYTLAELEEYTDKDGMVTLTLEGCEDWHVTYMYIVLGENEGSTLRIEYSDDEDQVIPVVPNE